MLDHGGNRGDAAPLISLLDDGDELRFGTEDYVSTYLAGDVLGAWRKFFAPAAIDMHDEAIEAMFGGDRDPQAVADERFWSEHELRRSSYWEPDLKALAGHAGRIMISVGDNSTGEECDRTSQALAERLGVDVTAFPGDHIGFVHDPPGFADRLRKVLAR